jgi:hypothetical protein
LEAEAEAEVAMMIHHHHMIMVPLQRRQHEAVMPQHEAVEQDKNNGDRAFGPGPSVELRLVIWRATGINHASQRRNSDEEDYLVVELAIQVAAAGSEVVVMLERVAQGHTVHPHRLRLQVDTRALVSDPQLEGRSEDVFI